MADVITRFKLETTQYDSKLRDASKGLSDVVKQASLAGNEFARFTQKNVEAARAFGNIATSATNSKDKVKELVGAFNDVAKAYNGLTKEQQQSDFGKALAESMTTLKGRIADAKQEMNSTGGILGQLKDKFTVNIDALKLFNAGLTATKAVLDVAKDAFFASEASVDEWGRVMDSSKSLYEGFLTALNTGDISGYLSRINDIVQAAREAYNELDRLGTMKTIQAPQMSAQQTENERMRMMIQTGRYIAPVDGRKAIMQNGQLLTPAQIKTLERQLNNGMNKVVGLVSNEVKQTTKAIDAVYRRQGQELGMSVKEFRKGTSSMAEFDKRIEGAARYREYERQHTTYDERSGVSHRDRTANPYEQYKGWDVFRVDGQRYNDLVKLILQRDQQASQAYSTMSQAYRTMNRAEGVTVRQIMGGGGGSGKGGGNTNTPPTYAADSIAAQTALVSELSKKWNEAGENMRDSYLYQLIAAENKLKDMKDKQSALREQQQSRNTAKAIKIDSAQGLSESLGIMPSLEAIQAELDTHPLEVHIETTTRDIKAISNAAKQTAQIVGTIGTAFNAIEDPAAKVAGTIAQSIANIAMAYSTALANDPTLKTSIWGLIAAAAASTVSMVTTISQIHSATGYAQGGEIKGNSFSGDNLMAMGPNGLIGLNAGELVLNASQQQTLASNLQNNGGGNFRLVGKLAGEDIILSAERAGKRMGYGQLMFWNGN